MPLRKVLIADDDRQIRAALRDVFIRDGFDTLLASDGLEARVRISPAYLLRTLLFYRRIRSFS